MNQKSFTIVTTTINIPNLLTKYAEDALRFKRKIEQFIVIGDKKTPQEVSTFCADLEQRYGIRCRYLSPNEQEKILSRWDDFKSFLPWNCIQRRNIGLILGYQGKSDIIVTIDDDNFICQPDYLGWHSHIGDIIEVESVSSQSGWWNVCEMLEESHGIPFYHRGHPLSKRWLIEESYNVYSSIRGRIIANAGLWLDDPDVDALTRLYFPICVSKPSEKFKSKIACDIGTLAPFNSQNTALWREVIPAYFLFPYIGRYDDIWASYVVRHISDYMGDLVTYGSPLVRQKRNPHNYFKDFDAERFGLEYNDIFLGALHSCKLSAKTYKEAYTEISLQFPEQIIKSCETRKVDYHIFDKACEGFRSWISIFI